MLTPCLLVVTVAPCTGKTMKSTPVVFEREEIFRQDSVLNFAPRI